MKREPRRQRTIGEHLPLPIPEGRATVGDAVQILPEFPDLSVDLILCDPPYFVEYQSHRGAQVTGAIDNDGKADVHVLMPALAPEFKRVVKPDGAVILFQAFGDGERSEIVGHVCRYLREAGFFVEHSYAWWKHAPGKNRLGMGRKKGPRNAVDQILVAVNAPGEYVWNRGQNVANVLEFDRGTRRAGDHPTPKPVPLLEELIDRYSDQGDLVLDPFCGGGSTLKAAQKKKRRFCGVDLCEEWVAMSNKRLGVSEAKAA